MPSHYHVHSSLFHPLPQDSITFATKTIASAGFQFEDPGISNLSAPNQSVHYVVLNGRCAEWFLQIVANTACEQSINV